MKTKPRVHKFKQKQAAEACRLKLMARDMACAPVIRNGDRYEFVAIHPIPPKKLRTVQWRFNRGIEPARRFCEFVDKKIGSAAAWVGCSLQNKCITVTAELPEWVEL